MRKVISLILIGLLLTAMLMGCGRPMEVPSNAPSTVTSVSDPEEGRDTTPYLRLVMNTPATLDPQKAGASNILTMNVFDRLVELQENSDGTSEIVPSIAKSWMISSAVASVRVPSSVQFSISASTVMLHVLALGPFSSSEQLTMADIISVIAIKYIFFFIFVICFKVDLGAKIVLFYKRDRISSEKVADIF